MKLVSKEASFFVLIYLQEIITDSTYSQTVKYKNLFEINLGEVVTKPTNKVTEVRTYKIGKHEITIIRLRCILKQEEEFPFINKRFKNIRTAFWKEKLQWHGNTKEYFRVY